MSTWIKLDRNVVKHWIFKDEWKFKCWIDMLVLANYSENKVEIKGMLFTCKRGELLYSLDSLSTRWGGNKSKVRRFLKLLESDSMIALKSEQVTTRITICNYESYQGERNADETQTKRKRNADETQTTPIKESKEKEENKEVIYSFDEFWKLYGKSSDKKSCLAKFEKLTNKELEKIKINLPNYILSTPDIKYRKNPLTWLNGKCWDDEIQIQSNNQSNVLGITKDGEVVTDMYVYSVYKQMGKL